MALLFPWKMVIVTSELTILHPDKVVGVRELVIPASVYLPLVGPDFEEETVGSHHDFVIFRHFSAIEKLSDF